MTKRVIAAWLLAAPAALLFCAHAWCVPAPAPPQQRAQATPAVAAKPTLGSISGKVTDARGVPQMGALVVVLAADGRVLHKLYTNEVGAFMQDRLVPGVYSLRVSLASFLPAVRDSIGVKAGGQNFLSINLSSLTDTLTGLINKTPHQDSDNDWKWVVRSSGGLRPVLRLLPGQSGSSPTLARVPGDDFGDAYRGRLEIAAGGSGSQGFGADADFSTRFSLAQTLFADTTLLLGGNIGMGADSLSPASAFRGVLRSAAPDGSSNQLSVTVRQIILPAGFVAVPSRGGDTFMASSADFERTTVLTDRVNLVYGSSYDSLVFLGHVSSINPHGKIVAKITPNSVLQISYSQGPERERRAQDLNALAFDGRGAVTGGDPIRDIADQLTVFPQVSLRSGSPAIERDRRVEAAYRIALDKKTTLEATLYHDQISDFSIGVAGQPSQFRAGVSDGQLLPDVFSNTATLNGGYQTLGGGRVAVRRRIGDYVEATASYSMAALPVPGLRTNLSDDLSNLAASLHNERRQSRAVKLGVQTPVTDTKIIASYKWMDGLAILPRDPYSDSIGQTDANFNIVIHQPLPQLTPFMGHVEAVAEVRNLLSQGYIPLITADGRRIFLLQNVKSFRGGFAVNF
jgi:hypothetical protein